MLSRIFKFLTEKTGLVSDARNGKRSQGTASALLSGT